MILSDFLAETISTTEKTPAKVAGEKSQAGYPNE